MLSQTDPSCTCGSIGNTDGVRFCAPCHAYWLNDRRLTSVTAVIKAVWPLRKSFEYADPTVLEHARERGIRVDRYFEHYLKYGTVLIPNGEWMDVIELTQGVIKWWNAQTFPAPRTQVIVHDNEVAGMVDLLFPDHVVDLKCVSAIDPTYALQLGAYTDLAGLGAANPGVIHANSKGIKLIEFNVLQCVEDWRICKAMWQMVNRRDPNGMAKARA